MTKRVLLIVVCATLSAPVSLFAQARIKTGLQILPGELPHIEARDHWIQYEFDLKEERFYVCVPRNYSGTEAFGILVFLSPSDECIGVPRGWETVLQDRKLIYIAPQRIGNGQPVARRGGLAVVSALKLSEFAKIDPTRIYVAGLSGGARVASCVAFSHPRLFSGVFAVCGINFCRKVERVNATQTDDYGWFTADQQRVLETKRRVKFALVTGSEDFRYGNILDIYRGGFLQDRYKVRLFDVPGMEHTLCPGTVLDDGIRWFDEAQARP